MSFAEEEEINIFPSNTSLAFKADNTDQLNGKRALN